MRRVDLHNHSFFSDGKHSPEHVVGLAKERGVELYALTDHDSVSGIERAREACRKAGIRFVDGIEINCALPDPVHILGLGLDPASPGLLADLEDWRGRRKRRVERIVGKVRDLGIDLTMEEVVATSRESLGRPHIADALVRRKVVSKRSEAFSKFLSRGKPAYVEPMGVLPEEAIEAIHRAGGKAVLAHPHIIGDSMDLPRWIEKGLDGLEAYYPKMSRAKREHFLGEAERNGLFVSGGSDFHGAGTGRDIPPGIEVPDPVFENLLSLARA